MQTQAELDPWEYQALTLVGEPVLQLSAPLRPSPRWTVLPEK